MFSCGNIGAIHEPGARYRGSRAGFARRCVNPPAAARFHDAFKAPDHVPAANLAATSKAGVGKPAENT
jgi:hypothetical protein